MDQQSDSQDPIIRTMQDPPQKQTPPPDRLPMEPIADATPIPDRPHGLGNPPSTTETSSPKPDLSFSKKSADQSASETPSPLQPVIPSIPTAPPSSKPAFTEHPRHNGSSHAAVITICVLIFVLLAAGLPLIWMKLGTLEQGISSTSATMSQNVGVVATKVDGFDQSFKLIQDANTTCKQNLAGATTTISKCGESASKVADLLLAEGTRQKTEGDATKNQPESSQGQWLIDRGNELKQTATACTGSPVPTENAAQNNP